MAEKFSDLINRVKKKLFINRYLKIFNVSDNCNKETYEKIYELNDNNLIIKSIMDIKVKSYNYYLKEFILSFTFLIYNILSVTFFNKILFGTSIFNYFLVLVLFILLPLIFLTKEVIDKKIDFNIIVVCIIMVIINTVNLLIVGNKFQELNASLKETYIYDIYIYPFNINYYLKGDLVGKAINFNFIFSILIFIFNIYLLIIGKKKNYELKHYNNTYSYTLFISILLILISILDILFNYKSLIIVLLTIVIIYDLISFRRRNLVDLFIIFCALGVLFYLFVRYLNVLGGAGYHLEYKNVFLFVVEVTCYDHEGILIYSRYTCDFSILFSFLSFVISLPIYIYKRGQIKEIRRTFIN